MKTLFRYKLGEKLKKRLTEVAKSEGKSASAEVRDLMRDYFSGKNRRKIKDMEFTLFFFKNKFGTLRKRKVIAAYSFPEIKLPNKFEKEAKKQGISSAVLLELVIANYLYPKEEKKEEQPERAWTR